MEKHKRVNIVTIVLHAKTISHKITMRFDTTGKTCHSVSDGATKTLCKQQQQKYILANAATKIYIGECSSGAISITFMLKMYLQQKKKPLTEIGIQTLCRYGFFYSSPFHTHKQNKKKIKNLLRW